MKSWLLLFLCLVITIDASAQSNRNCTGSIDSVLHKFVYHSVDKMPQPEGGLEVLLKSMLKGVKYKTTIDFEFVGKISIGFIVEPDGQIEGERMVSGNTGLPVSFSDQLLHLIRKTKWLPGTCNGKPVPVFYILPIHITMPDQ